MPFPRRLLAPGERLVLDIRPHWIALVVPSLQTLVIIVGTAFALKFIPDDWASWTRWGTLLLAVLLLIAFPVRRLVSWITSHFVVTSDRLIHREGWFAKRSMEIPLERVNDVRFEQSILERIVGAGDLRIESAGEYGQNAFTHIRHPERVQKLIFEMGEENQARMSRGESLGGPRDTDRLDTGARTTERTEARTTEDLHTAGLTVPEQLERLAALRDRGVINEQEYAEEKARILGE